MGAERAAASGHAGEEGSGPFASRSRRFNRFVRAATSWMDKPVCQYPSTTAGVPVTVSQTAQPLSNNRIS
jgi:hypothetical protein